MQDILCSGGAGGSTEPQPGPPPGPAADQGPAPLSPGGACPDGVSTYYNAGQLGPGLPSTPGCYSSDQIASMSQSLFTSGTPVVQTPDAPGATPGCIVNSSGQVCGQQAAQWQQQNPSAPYCPGGYKLTSGGCVPPNASQPPVPSQNAQGQRCAPALFFLSACGASPAAAQSKARTINIVAGGLAAVAAALLVWKLV